MIDKRRVYTTVNRYALNPFVKAGATIGIPPTVAILETTGRRSEKPRRVPVGNGLKGDTFWLVAEHGRRAGYVRNIEADPHVRVKVGRRWRSGTAHLLPDDDPRERTQQIGLRLNGAVVRAVGTDLLSVRIDLDPS